MARVLQNTSSKCTAEESKLRATAKEREASSESTCLYLVRRMKILLVEDHEFLAQITCSILREIHEHDVEHAATAATALELAAHSAFDMALVDINLPDMDGYQLAERLRTFSHMSECVLVALTGIGSAINPERALAAGFDEFYSKPMDFGRLEKIKRSALDRCS
jgi:CheY-like chemotaxis protein